MTTDTLTVGSIFSGIGCIDRGLEAAGLRVAWQCEIDPVCRNVLARHWPDVRRYEDVRDCGAYNLAPVDVIAFGSPCQGLSQAGQRKGFSDERSGLYREAIRIIRELRPALALWENVFGALSSTRGRDFGLALDVLAESGALDVAWRVLDSRWFGSAQRRRRVFVVADFRGERAAEILFESESSQRDTAPRRETGQRAAATITSGVGVTGNAPGRRREDDVNLVYAPEVSSTIGGGFKGAGGGNRVGLNTDSVESLIVHETPREVAATLKGRGRGACDEVMDNLQIVHTLTSEGADASEDGTGRGVPIIAFDWQSGGDVRLHCRTNGTSALQTNQTPAVLYRTGIRRLTPTEVERLFCLPDGYTAYGADGKPISDSARYRMLGNGAVTTVLEWIGERILSVMESQPC